jgi:hypothetical protein
MVEGIPRRYDGALSDYGLPRAGRAAMNLFFWVLLNLGVPVAGPVFTLALIVPVHGWRVAKTLIAAW